MTVFFITILNMSIMASIAALAVMLIRMPLRKAPKIFSYLLWGAVLFRLIFPFSIESIFSLMPMSGAAIPQSIVYSPNPAIQTGLQFFDMPINAVISNALPPVNHTYSVNPVHIVLEIAGYVWLIGFIALLFYVLLGYIGLKNRIRYATLVSDNIFETDKIKTPFVLGFIRPKIFLPLTVDPIQQAHILKHEQIHIKRRDYLIKSFAFLVLAFHWFNPLMWISYFLMSKDMEMSCDEAVLRKTDEDIRDIYSASLLNLAVKRASLLNPIAFGESNVKERVVNVLSFKKPKVWVVIILLVVVSAFLVGFASDRVTLVTIDVPSVQNVARQNPAIAYETVPANGTPFLGIAQVTNDYNETSPLQLNHLRIILSPSHTFHNIGVTNVGDNAIARYTRVSLAYDGDGNPLKLCWDAYVGEDGSLIEVSEKSYSHTTGWNFQSPLDPAQTVDGFTSATGDNIVEHLLTIVKDVTFADGSVWVNPDFDSWLAAYEGKPIAVSSIGSAIKPYEHLGISVDMARGLMMYEGHPVREIWDSTTGTLITESAGANGFSGRNISGAVDLTAVYENGVLVGLKISTQEEYDIRTKERHGG